MQLLDDTIKFLLCFAASLERGLQKSHASLALSQSSPVLAWWEVCSRACHSVAISIFRNRELGELSTGKVSWAVYTPKSSAADTLFATSIYFLFFL